MEHIAIYNLYPNAKSINETEDGVLEVKDADGNEVSIDMSAVNTKAAELQTQAEADKQSLIDLKASAKAKLMAGEALTEDEANVMIGG
jgi:diaminopimelate epimerase